MYQFERHFTLEEAEAEIPRLRSELAQVQEQLRLVDEARQDAGPAVEHTGGNGGGAAPSRYLRQQIALAEAVSAITDRGIQIKDPWRGLVDFPHIRDGNEVLLCWLLEEPHIRYWHGLEEGFIGRRPL